MMSVLQFSTTSAVFLWCNKMLYVLQHSKTQQVLDDLEIFFKAIAVIICKSGNPIAFSFRSLRASDQFPERRGSFADTGCEQGIQSSTLMLIETCR